MSSEGVSSDNRDWDEFMAQINAEQGRHWHTRHLERFGEAIFSPSETVGERYRFLYTEWSIGMFRIEVTSGQVQIIAKHIPNNIGENNHLPTIMQEFSRPLKNRKLSRLRKLIERSSFWELPSWNDDRLGFDGYSCIIEAQVGERYHLVDRWVPKGDGFARLCDFCIGLYKAEIKPRRWWRFW